MKKIDLTPNLEIIYIYFNKKCIERLKAMAEPRTCLDCGFLTIRDHEISHPQRIMLGTKGKSGVMPSHPEETRCFKNLWEYDLHYHGDIFEGVVEEIDFNRNECSGFLQYEAGFTPEQHLENQIEKRKEKLQWRIAKLGFLGALLGGILGIIIVRLFNWTIGLVFK